MYTRAEKFVDDYKRFGAALLPVLEYQGMEHVTLDSHPLCDPGEMMSDRGIVTGWEGAQS